MKINWKWSLLLVSALALRLIGGAFFYHTDLKNIYIDSQYLKSGVKNAYHLASADNRALPYPPAVYIILQAHQNINKWMFSGYLDRWLADGTARQTELHPEIFRDLFAMKFPMLIADILIGLILYLLVSKTKRLLTMVLWFLNPVSWYAIYAFGNFDIFPTLALAGSYLMIFKKRYHWAYILLGLAAGLKLFAVMIVPLLLIVDSRPIKQRAIGMGLFLFGFLSLVFPVLTDSIAFKSVFMSNLSNTLFKTQIYLAEGHVLPLFLLFYFLFLAFVASKKVKIDFVTGSFVILGGLLGLSHFHPQWILWIVPSAVILFVEKRANYIYYLAAIISFYGVSLLINDKFVGLGLLKAINDAFDTIKPVRFYADVLGIGITIQGLFQALLLSSVVAIGFIKSELVTINTKWLLITFVTSWLIFVPTSFALVHIPLIKYGRYIDLERLDQKERIILDSKKTITQTFKMKHDNLSSILLKIKNVDLVNTGDLIMKITDEAGVEVRKVVVNGRAIGDDFDLIIFFTPIPDSSNKTYSLSLSQPTAIKDKELLIPFNQNYTGDGLKIDNIPVRGSLGFTTYYNPGTLKANILWSLNNIKEKIF